MFERTNRGHRGSVILLGVVLLLAGCDDRDDRDDRGDAVDPGAEPVAEPVTFEVEGTLCGRAVSYEAPPDGALRLVTTPSGLLVAVVVSDGGLIKSNEIDAREAYAADHDLFAFLQLEEPAELRAGSLGWVSAAQVMARGFGSSELSGLGQKELVISEYGDRIVAGSLTDSIDWFTESYPELGRDGCQEGELSLSFRGPYELWDGQDECFSPSQNLTRLAHDFVVGCACDANIETSRCVTVCDNPSEASGVDAACDGVAIALVCSEEQWSWGYDGPCMRAD